MRLVFDDEVHYRRCEACAVEWLGPMPCWWCGELTPAIAVAADDDWLDHCWSAAAAPADEMDQMDQMEGPVPTQQLGLGAGDGPFGSAVITVSAHV